MSGWFEEALDEIEKRMLDVDAYYDGVRALVRRAVREIEAGRLKLCPECRAAEPAEPFSCWACDDWGVMEAKE